MPTGFTPVYKIIKDGTDITGAFNDRTTSIQIDLKGGGGDSDTCAITIDDRDSKVAAVKKGIRIEVFLGYEEVGYAQRGIFEINTIDYQMNPREIKIVGNSTGFTSSLKTPAIASFENQTLGDILGTFAKQGNVELSIDPDLAKEKLPFVNQTTSPLHLMHELERRFGAIAKFESGKLVFNKRDSGESSSGRKTPLLLIKPEHVSAGFVRHTERSEYSGVKVGYFDENHVKKYHSEASGCSGGEAAGDFLSGKVARTLDEAKAMAKAQLGSLRRSMGEAHLTLSKGDPWIRDNMRMRLSEFRDEVDGSYVTDTVTHTFVKDAGIGTSLTAKPPGTGESYAAEDDGGAGPRNADPASPKATTALPVPSGDVTVETDVAIDV